MSLHVTVLFGGSSSERDVSLISGAAVCDSLKDSGCQVNPIDVGLNIGSILTDLRPRHYMAPTAKMDVFKAY